MKGGGSPPPPGLNRVNRDLGHRWNDSKYRDVAPDIFTREEITVATVTQWMLKGLVFPGREEK